MNATTERLNSLSIGTGTHTAINARDIRDHRNRCALLWNAITDVGYYTLRDAAKRAGDLALFDEVFRHDYSEILGADEAENAATRERVEAARRSPPSKRDRSGYAAHVWRGIASLGGHGVVDIIHMAHKMGEKDGERADAMFAVHPGGGGGGGGSSDKDE